MSARNIYLIGSLRNENVPKISHQLREQGHDVFDDWYAAGPEADDYWRDYERGRGHNLPEALKGHAARHVFAFDTLHLERCDTAVLLLPAGRSGHLELGFARGRGKDTAILMEGEPDRYDVMYQFANLGVFFRMDDLINGLGGTARQGSDGDLRRDGDLLSLPTGPTPGVNVCRVFAS